MTAELILKTVAACGGAVWVESGGKLRFRIPTGRPEIIPAMKESKPELLVLLSSIPIVPAGVRLLRYRPKPAPVQLSRCERVTDVHCFIQATLGQVDARLHGKAWLAGNWPLSGLIERLAVVGCIVELENRTAMLQ